MRQSTGPIYIIIMISKVVLYSIVFFRAFSRMELSAELILITAAILACDLWRSIRIYRDPGINLRSLYLSLGLAAVYTVITMQGSYDKLFLIYALEGIAVLPLRQALVFMPLALLTYTGVMVFDELRQYGQLQVPSFPEAALVFFLMLLILGERWQREQRLVYEQLNNTLKFVNRQLQASIAWNEAFSAESERRRLAAELHDSLGHELTGLIISLEAGRRLQEQDPEKSHRLSEQALRTARAAMQSVRELVSASPDNHAEFVLPVRLEQMIHDVAALSGMEVDSACDPALAEMPASIQFHLYRIFQEALTNTLRHAGAERVVIRIGCNNGTINFSYQDNGFGTSLIQEGNGLRGIRERVEAMRGRISFGSAVGKGFTIEGTIGERG